jgi:hypothetical protein
VFWTLDFSRIRECRTFCLFDLRDKVFVCLNNLKGKEETRILLARAFWGIMRSEVGVNIVITTAY